MIVCKYIEKFRDKNGRIHGYRLIDKHGSIKDVQSDALKSEIRRKNIHVVNLTLTSDNRLVDSNEEHAIKMEDKISACSMPIDKNEDNIGKSNKQCRAEYKTREITNELIRILKNYGVDVIDSKNNGDCNIVKLNALYEFDNTVVIIDGKEKKAVWLSRQKQVFGVIHADCMEYNIKEILAANEIYKLASSKECTLLSGVEELISEYNEFMSYWTCEASDWPDAFGIPSIRKVVADFLHVSTDDIEDGISLKVEGYKRIGSNEENIYCSNEHIDVTYEDIVELIDKIREQVRENEEEESKYVTWGHESVEELESAMDILEEQYNLGFCVTSKVDDNYPHEGSIKITKDGLYSEICMSNFENILLVTELAKEGEGGTWVDADITANEDIRRTGDLARVIARTLKFDKLFSVNIQNTDKDTDNTVKDTGNTGSFESYIAKILQCTEGE